MTALALDYATLQGRHMLDLFPQREGPQGIDAARWVEMVDRYLLPEFADLYSAVCRPGAWEYVCGSAARRALEGAGYSPLVDWHAPWRVWWLHDFEGHWPIWVKGIIDDMSTGDQESTAPVDR